jgi:hypothetical protein
MNDPLAPRKTAPLILAFLLWLLTLVIGLEVIYAGKEIFYLLVVQLGGDIHRAERLVPLLVYLLGTVFLVFAIGTTEYHRKWAGELKSWRVFGLSLSVELSVLVLYYFL